MGTKITDLLEGDHTSIQALHNKTFTVDAHNILYQFLSTIRQRDGTYLTDSNGNVTSHLVGLFNRITTLMEDHMQFIFCFDGEIPDLKAQELDERKQRKQEAKKKYEEAKQEGDEQKMRKFAKQHSKLTPDMIDEAKKLIDALGQVWLQAPSEGEAQASHIVANNDAYAVISQDADCFLFGAPRLVKNLTITGKRKLPGKQAYTTIKPELLTLADTLNELGIDQEQLIALAMLVGTDFNPKGIHGIGPKTAIKLVTKHGHDFESLFTDAKWNDHFDIPWQRVMDAFTEMPVTDEYDITFSDPNENAVNELLVHGHDFDEERVQTTLNDLEQALSYKQKGLGEF